MRFNFSQKPQGWYPAHITDPILIKSLVTTNANMIVHDFIDHGPTNQFTYEDELLAIGSLQHTKIKDVSVVRCDFNDDEKELIYAGKILAEIKYPTNITFSDTFQDRLDELIRTANYRLFSSHINMKFQPNLTLIEKNCFVDFVT
jgi:hypothetical protein